MKRMNLYNITTLLKLAIPLYITHAIEEYNTRILSLDPLFRWITLHHLPTVALYMVEQIVLAGLLLWAIYQPKWWLLIFIGLLFIFEITHIIPALEQLSYYPGLVTAILLVALGVIYWRELFIAKKLTQHTI